MGQLEVIAHLKSRPGQLEGFKAQAAEMLRLTRALASAIPTARTQQIDGAGHAATFDATSSFVHVIADTVATDGLDRT